MHKIMTLVLLSFLLATNSYAASWTTLQDNKHAKLMLDKQSITASGRHQKAWVKIHYKTLQTNLEYPEKSYNNAKLLWYFNCSEQKSATAQVYQLLGEEQIFSAAIDVKRARFMEPVPETEVDLAMRYVCRQKALKEVLKLKQEAAKTAMQDKKEFANKKEKVQKPVEVEKPPVVIEEESEKTVNAGEKSRAESKRKLGNKKDKKNKSKKSTAKKEAKHKKVHWKYKGKKGPEFWGDLSPDFVTCKTGRNQSPIDISNTITAPPKPIKTFQRFPVKDIVNNGHTVLGSFKSGNMMAVDSVMYQMKQVHFHAPSEHTIEGISYPLEAHFVHADPKGNLAVLAVMYEDGPENKAIAKLWKQIPKRKGKPKKLKSKVLAGQMMPRKKLYYRFSGSLTTPPCSEGVIWIVMKSPMTISKQQVAAFKKVIRHDNNRPVQPLNGRLVIE